MFCTESVSFDLPLKVPQTNKLHCRLYGGEAALGQIEVNGFELSERPLVLLPGGKGHIESPEKAPV